MKQAPAKRRLTYPGSATLATKPCVGTDQGPCRHRGRVKAVPRFKRCQWCREEQIKLVKTASFIRHWPQYREQRRWKRSPHPKREAVLNLAAACGLPVRAA